MSIKSFSFILTYFKIILNLQKMFQEKYKEIL